MIKKSAKVEKAAISDDDLNLINQFTLKELTAEEVFTFKIAICDNQVDRDFEKFSDSALIGLAELFKGKTIISDHKASSENQCARIYKTEIVTDGESKKLVAHCYTARTDSNKDFIADVESGIKKEVSVGCSVEKAICSICGVDNKKSYCKHIGGREYGTQKCYFILDGAKDAYEVSFVAVPAQKNAGVIKSYGEKPYEETEKSATDEIESEIDCDLQLTDAFLFTENN